MRAMVALDSLKSLVTIGADVSTWDAALHGVVVAVGRAFVW